MSATLYWRPRRPLESKSLDDQLRFILNLDGVSGPVPFGRSNLDYLRGLADAEVKDAQTLIDAIEKHDDVELWLEY